MRTLVGVFLVLVIGFSGAVGCAPAISGAGQAKGRAEAATDTLGHADIRLGVVSTTPDKEVARLKPFGDYLVTQLKSIGVQSATVKVAPDLPTMVNMLKNGEVDLFFGTPYPSMYLADATGATAILRRWKDGEPTYASVIFARADAGIGSLNDLRGKHLALESDDSTSGYMLPLSHLIQLNFKPVRKASTDAAVAAGEVGYVFTGSDDATRDWVVSGRTAAGATGFQKFQAMSQSAGVKLTIIAQTEQTTRNVVMARSGLNAGVINQLKTQLKGLAATADGVKAMNAFDGTTQFDEFPWDAGAGVTHDRMRELYRITRSAQ